MYMAACAYVYYRLYIITGDEHYHDFAEFIHNNTRQANDVDGSFGYALPGLSHEGGHFATQTFTSHYHWLPWVTYVEIDPTSRGENFDQFILHKGSDASHIEFPFNHGSSLLSVIDHITSISELQTDIAILSDILDKIKK